MQAKERQDIRRNIRKMKKTPSKSSPTGKKRGCLCKDGTYSSKCCDGSLQAQGIGALTGQGTTP